MNHKPEQQDGFFVTIEKLKVDFLKQLSTLLERQISSRNFDKNIVILEQEQSNQMKDVLESLLTQTKTFDFVENKIEHCNNISHSLEILHKLQDRNSWNNITNLKNILFDLNCVFDKLFSEHELLGRKTDVQIKHYATHDVLTGLYNRHYFDSIINHEINRSEQHHSNFSVLMIDLDNFKIINDSYGHMTGDMVLKNVTNMILAPIRHGDLVARVGGDEFAVMLMETELNQAVNIAERIRNEIKEMGLTSPSGETFHVSVSIGVSNYPDTADDMVSLMSGVDIALYQAKDSGKNSVFLSSNPKNSIDAAHHSLNYLEKIRIAMKEDRVIPYFQPIVNSYTGDIYAYEALARIKDVNGDIISANAFIEIVEKSILNYDFHKIIVYKALKLFKLKLQENKNSIRLFINLSVVEIQNKKILEDANNMCQKLNISPNLITFELLERDAINDIYRMQDQMNMARSKGFTFAIDDFGSAYNSLSYLREMSLEYLKIEGSFVKNILNSKTDYILVKHIQDLCRELGIIVIAEFVESKEILIKLQEANIPYGQGYYLGRPMDFSNQ